MTTRFHGGKRILPYSSNFNINDICKSIAHCYIPYNYNRWSTGPSVTINYTNKTWTYFTYWQQPKADVSKYIRIVFNGNLKEGKIKRVIEKINSQLFQLEKVFIKGFNQIYHLYLIKLVFENDIKNAHYIECTNQFMLVLEEEIEFYAHYYKLLSDYYYNLHKYITKYNILLEIVKGADICACCFKKKTPKSLTKIRRNHKLCDSCVMDNNEENECPICLESFPSLSMTNTNCGNGHQTCMVCYHTLKKIDTKCPICRGRL